MTIFNYAKIKKKKHFYMIAEIGVNHECSIQKAKKIITTIKSKVTIETKNNLMTIGGLKICTMICITISQYSTFGL